MTVFRIFDPQNRWLEAFDFAAVVLHWRETSIMEITDQPNTGPTIYFVVNSITGAATISAPTRELIEKWRNYSDQYIKPKGPEWVICEFSRALGITLLNFTTFPKSMIWDGVAIYARGAVK